jgi:hypothetical protein
MGRISVWKPWLGVAAGALLTPLLVIAVIGFISWSHFRQLWPGSRGRTSSYGNAVVSIPPER